MKVRGTERLLALGLFIATASGFAGSAKAQADVTAQRPADLLVFGGYSNTKPDYGYIRNNGVTFGVDYDRSFGLRVIPGLEIRANISNGSVIDEHTYLGGLRGHMNLARRFHPYADFLVGVGKADYAGFNGVTIHDSGLIYDAGAGVDVDFARNLMLKADYQLQFWNLGPNGFTKPNGEDFTLSPETLTIGVTYRIPFRRWVDQAHNHD